MERRRQIKLFDASGVVDSTPVLDEWFKPIQYHHTATAKAGSAACTRIRKGQGTAKKRGVRWFFSVRLGGGGEIASLVSVPMPALACTRAGGLRAALIGAVAVLRGQTFSIRPSMSVGPRFTIGVCLSIGCSEHAHSSCAAFEGPPARAQRRLSLRTF